MSAGGHAVGAKTGFSNTISLQLVAPQSDKSGCSNYFYKQLKSVQVHKCSTYCRKNLLFLHLLLGTKHSTSSRMGSPWSSGPYSDMHKLFYLSHSKGLWNSGPSCTVQHSTILLGGLPLGLTPLPSTLFTGAGEHGLSSRLSKIGVKEEEVE